MVDDEGISIAFSWSDIRGIIPFFPFLTYVSVCAYFSSNVHAYTVCSAISPFVWRNLTSAQPSECDRSLFSIVYRNAQLHFFFLSPFLLFVPCRENRLLIVHGLIDENVHFHHTSLLIDELVRNCKPYHVQVSQQNIVHWILTPRALLAF